MRNHVPVKKKKMHITVSVRHDGKMTGMRSINTSTRDCRFCQKMQKTEGTICQYCYTNRIEDMHENYYNFYHRNYVAINSVEFQPVTYRWKKYSGSVRFNAIGELSTNRHLLNYMKIVGVNPHINFTLWTKRNDLIINNVEAVKKHSNLILIGSSPYINRQEKLSLDIYDKIFTVYTPDYANKHNIKINCGSYNIDGTKKKCVECQICYSRKFESIKIVNELLK